MAEASEWQAEARLVSLLGLGLTFEESWHMPPLLANKLQSISAAWSIPPDEREAPVALGTVADARRLFGG